MIVTYRQTMPDGGQDVYLTRDSGVPEERVTNVATIEPVFSRNVPTVVRLTFLIGPTFTAYEVLGVLHDLSVAGSLLSLSIRVPDYVGTMAETV